MFRYIKYNLHKIFLRDLDITLKGFLFFLGGFIYSLISIEFFIISVVKYLYLPYSLIFITSMIISIVLAGFIVDMIKNRMLLILVSSSILIIGLFLTFFAIPLLEIIGLIIIFASTSILVIDLHTILVHESTILNRGRLNSYLLIFSITIASFILLISFINKIIILVILTIIICINAFYIIKEYSYIETDERLASDLSFKKYLFQAPIKGYIFVFLLLSIIIGFSWPISIPIILDSLPLTLIILSYLIFFGISLDKRGRKWTFTAGLLTLMILFLFRDLYFIEIIYDEFFLGISIPLAFTLILTFAGDFATERNKIKYRGRILSILLMVLILGFICGIVFNGLLNLLNNLFPEILWFSTLLNIMCFVLLIISLVRMMPLPEILSAKEADWAETIKSIYIFNKDSICLFNKDYNNNSDEDDSLCEDLVTSGFTGIIGLVSEITNEQKNLRIIDKERVKIYFTYGKYVNIALISTKFLPILFKKMQIFMKAFEKRFEAELKDFKGNINVFLKETNHIIQKYFK